MKLEEPAVAYNVNTMHALQQKTSNLALNTSNRKILQNCLIELKSESMPCIFSDEEYKEEIRLSEESANVSNDDVNKELQSWGFVM